jgi:hypothetical protein
MAKSITNDELVTALVNAGLIDTPADVARVLIDIQPGRIPMVYVEKHAHPNAVARVVAEHFGPTNLVPPTPDSEEV